MLVSALTVVSHERVWKSMTLVVNLSAVPFPRWTAGCFQDLRVDLEPGCVWIQAVIGWRWRILAHDDVLFKTCSCVCVTNVCLEIGEGVSIDHNVRRYDFPDGVLNLCNHCTFAESIGVCDAQDMCPESFAV